MAYINQITVLHIYIDIPELLHIVVELYYVDTKPVMNFLSCVVAFFDKCCDIIALASQLTQRQMLGPGSHYLPLGMEL